MNFEVEAIVVLLNPVLSIVPVSRYMYVELVPEICKRVHDQFQTKTIS